MELRNIKSFIKVAEFENLSRAAEALGYAQSTITTQIQQLEQELGTTLFDRIGKRVLLSENGRTFLAYANEMLKLEAEALASVSEDKPPSGTVRIGITETIGGSFFSALLEEYLEKYPEIRVEIICGVTLELYDQLEKGGLDIILLLDRPIYRPALQTVFSHPCAVPFVCSAAHPFANQKEISPEKLTHETLLLSEKNNNYRQVFDELLSEHGILLEKPQELSHLTIILSFLEKNLGISFLPDYAIPSDLQEKNLALFNVTGFDIQMQLQILYHRQKWVSPAMQCFTTLAESFLTQFYAQKKSGQ